MLELFDISTKDAVKNDEDMSFLLMQQEDTLSSSMAGVDNTLAAKESRKRIRESKAEARRQLCAAENQQLSRAQSSAVHESGEDQSGPSDSDDHAADADYTTPIAKCRSDRKKTKKFLSPAVVSSLDRVNISDHRALFVVGTVAAALGHPIEELSLSRSTIRRTRLVTRELVAMTNKASFSPIDPLILHWDGKLLPDIVHGKQKVDRVAILVTGGGTEKLLAVPQLGRGTGDEQAKACLRALDD